MNKHEIPPDTLPAKTEDDEPIVVDLGNGYEIRVTTKELEQWAEEHRQLEQELDDLFRSTRVTYKDLNTAMDI